MALWNEAYERVVKRSSAAVAGRQSRAWGYADELPEIGRVVAANLDARATVGRAAAARIAAWIPFAWAVRRMTGAARALVANLRHRRRTGHRVLAGPDGEAAVHAGEVVLALSIAGIGVRALRTHGPAACFGR